MEPDGNRSPDLKGDFDNAPPPIDEEDAISTLSYLINLQDTKLEHENKEETYLNEKTTQLIADKYEVVLKQFVIFLLISLKRNVANWKAWENCFQSVRPRNPLFSILPCKELSPSRCQSDGKGRKRSL